ncbi:hypothetical protein K432DRAFT_425224 [Lepidopterella palustris CBS 459.81]|uniref:Uncharacterized protein n=1 Tax=Lepidopterella palustris CBS 459.81 TaxID=1314670 RepID=A0A8E2EBY5_9PEZI|nr:hypothetical protein K432DRAFT_425224 [Lepidopterella palustris CBS 459.81]
MAENTKTALRPDSQLPAYSSPAPDYAPYLQSSHDGPHSATNNIAHRPSSSQPAVELPASGARYSILPHSNRLSELSGADSRAQVELESPHDSPVPHTQQSPSHSVTPHTPHSPSSLRCNGANWTIHPSQNVPRRGAGVGEDEQRTHPVYRGGPYEGT